jgi:hypothetical protein
MSYQAWTADDVAAELGRIGLGKYSQAFVDQEITGDLLSGLTTSHLREMGLTIGARIAAQKWITSLSYTEVPKESLDERTDADERVECPECKRRFATDRIARHRAACGKLGRREPFDSHQMRVRDLEPATPSPPQSPEAKQQPRNRSPCCQCGRRCGNQSAENQENACAQLKKRPVFDSRAKRLNGTGAEEFLTRAEDPVKPESDFRKGHATLHEMIKTARRLSKLRRMLEAH